MCCRTETDVSDQTGYSKAYLMHSQNTDTSPASGSTYPVTTEVRQSNPRMPIWMTRIMTLKGANRFFFSVLGLFINPFYCNFSGQGAIVFKSRATHRALITCTMSCAKWYKGTARFDRAEIAFILALFPWLKPLTGEGREETEVPEENPR